MSFKLVAKTEAPARRSWQGRLRRRQAALRETCWPGLTRSGSPERQGLFPCHTDKCHAVDRPPALRLRLSPSRLEHRVNDATRARVRSSSPPRSSERSIRRGEWHGHAPPGGGRGLHRSGLPRARRGPRVRGHEALPAPRAASSALRAGPSDAGGWIRWPRSRMQWSRWPGRDPFMWGGGGGTAHKS